MEEFLTVFMWGECAGIMAIGLASAITDLIAYLKKTKDERIIDWLNRQERILE